MATILDQRGKPYVIKFEADAKAALVAFDKIQEGVDELRSGAEGAAKKLDKLQDGVDGLGEAAADTSKQVGKLDDKLDDVGRGGKKGLDSAAKSAASLGARIKAAVGVAGDFSQTVTTFANQYLPWARSLLGTITQIDSTLEGIRRGGRFDDLSAQLGVSVETLTRFELLLKDSGVGLEQYSVAIKTLSRNLFDFQNNTGEARVALARLGFDKAALAGLDAADAFAKIVPKMAQIENAADRAAIAQKVFGESGTILGSFFSQSQEEMERLLSLSDRLGLTLTTQQAEILDTVSDNLDIFSNSLAGIGQKIAIGLAPGLNKALESAIELVADLISRGEDFELFGKSLGDIFSDLSGSIEDIRREIADMDLGAALEAALDDATVAVAESAARLGGVFTKAFFKALFVREYEPEELARMLGVEELSQQASRLLYGSKWVGGLGKEGGREFARLFGEEAIKRLPEELGEAIRISIAKLDVEGALDDAKPKYAKLKDGLRRLIRSDGKDLTKPDPTKGSEPLAGPPNIDEQIKSQEAAVAAAQALADETMRLANTYVGAIDAEKRLAEAKAESARQSTLAADGTREQAQEVYNLTLAQEEANQKQALATSLIQGEAAIASDRERLELLNQRVAGLITEVELRRELAIMAAGENEALREQAATRFEITEQIAAAEGKLAQAGQAANEAIETSFLGLGTIAGEVQSAFNQVFDAIIAGTLDIKEVFNSFGLAIGKNLFNQILTEKLQFDTAFKGNIAGLGENVVATLGAGFTRVFDGFNGDLRRAEEGAAMFADVFPDAGPRDSGLISSPAFEDDKPIKVETVDTDILKDGALSTASDASMFGDLFTDDGMLGEVGGALGDFGGAIGDVIGGIGQMAGALGAVAGVAMMLVEVFSMLFQQVPTRGTRIRQEIIAQLQGEKANQYFAGLGDRGVTFDLDVTGEIAGGSRDPETSIVPFGSGYRRAMAYGQLGLERMPFGTPEFDEQGRLINPVYTGNDQALLYAAPGMGFRGGQAPSAAQIRWMEENGPDVGGNLYRPYKGFDPGQTQALFGGAAAVGPMLFGADRSDPGALYDASFSAGVVWVQGFTDALDRGLSPEQAYELAQRTAYEAAKAAGINLSTALGDISNIYVDAIAYQRKSDSPTSEEENMAVIAEQLGVTVAGGIELFRPDFARGTQLQIAVLQSFQHAIRDANGEVVELTGPVLGALSPALQQALVDGTATFEDMAKIFEQYIGEGFELDPEIVMRKLQAIGASAQTVTESFAESMAEGPTSAFEIMGSIISKVRNQIIAAFDQEVTGQILDATNIAGSFADVFEVIQNIGDYDLLGDNLFSEDLRRAIESGKENLEFYAPRIREAVKASKELRELLDDLFAPSELEEFFMLLEQKVEQFKSSIGTSAGSAVDAGRSAFEANIEEQQARRRAQVLIGVEVDPLSVERATKEGRKAFADTMRAEVRESITEAIIQAMIDAAVKKAVLAPMLAQLEAETAAAMEDGVIDEMHAARLTALGDNIIREGDRAARQLGPIFAHLLGIEYDATILDEQERELIKLAKKHGVLPADLAAFMVAAEGVDPDALTRYFALLVEQEKPYRDLARNIRLYSEQIRESVDEDTLTQFLKQVEGVDPEALTRYFAWLVEQEKKKREEAEQREKDEIEAQKELTDSMKLMAEAVRNGIGANEDATASLVDMEAAVRSLISVMEGGSKGRAMGGALSTSEDDDVPFEMVPMDLGEMRQGIARAVQDGMIEGSSTADTVEAVKAAVVQSTIDGLVQGFLISAVIMPLIEPALQLIANAIGRVVAGEISVQAAIGIVTQAVGIIKDIFNSPEMQAAFEIITVAIGELRGLAPSLNSINDEIDRSIDSSERAIKAQCDLVEVVTSLGAAAMDVGGGSADVSISRYIPADEVAAAKEEERRAAAQPAFDRFINENYPELSGVKIQGWGIGTPEQRARKAARSEFYEQNPDFKDVQVFAKGGLVTRPTLGLVGEAGPELIVPLRNLSATQGSGGLSEEVRGLREDLRRVANAIEQQPIDVSLNVDGRQLHTVVGKADRISKRVRSSFAGGN